MRLRAIGEEDLRELYRLFNDPASWGEFEEFHPVDWFTFEKRQKEAGATPDRTLFLIEKKESKEVLGVIFQRITNPTMKNTEIGYAILSSKERRKGFASESTRLIVDYLFLSKNIERIEAYTDLRNIASHRVLEKCGFKREGTMRKARYVAGAFRDYYIWSILREEWKPPENQSGPTI